MYWFRQHLFSEESQTFSLWFSQDEISSKRQHIRKAILEIAEQQNPDTIRKLGLESKKKKTATKAVEKYNDWLNQMMTSEFHFYRGYSEIEIPGKVSSAPNRRFDNEANTCVSPSQPLAGNSSDVEQTDHDIAEEEKGLEIPPPTNCEGEQPRRSKRIRKNKFIFNLWQYNFVNSYTAPWIKYYFIC